MARSHSFNGTYSLEFLQERYEGAHEVAYPPGFGIALSTLMWASALSADSFVAGPALDRFVFLYRLAVGCLGLSFLGGVVALFGTVTRSRSLPWVIALVLALLVPSLLGQPCAAEVFLVPLAGYGILAMIAARYLGRREYLLSGGLLAAFLFFVKNDAVLIVPLLWGPWAIAAPKSSPKISRNLGPIALGAVSALVPWIVWRVPLSLAQIDVNFMFSPVNEIASIKDFSLLRQLVVHAMKIVLRSELWTALLVMLPLAAVWRGMTAKWRARDLAVPGGIVTFGAVVVSIFLISRAEPLVHLDLSLERLLLVAVLSAVLFCSETVCLPWKSDE